MPLFCPQSVCTDCAELLVLTVSRSGTNRTLIGIRVCSTHACRHEEQTWSMERTDSMNSDCQSGGLSSSVGTSKCSSPACMARRAAYWGCTDISGTGMQYGESYDSLRDSPHSDRYEILSPCVFLLFGGLQCLFRK